MESTKQLILELAGAVGAPGMESAAIEAAERHLLPLGECTRTALGSLVCKVKQAAADRPHLMLTAHIDEISLIVSYIDEQGFLHVSNCGGMDRATLWASQVVVHTEKGPLSGVVCTIPPHLNPDQEKYPKVEDLAIDIGLEETAAKAAVQLGDRVTLGFTAEPLLNDLLCTKAADDRAGCASVILAAQKLAKETLDCSLTVLLATMEEVGGQGAKTGANAVAPTHAIAVDVSFAHTPDAQRAACGDLQKGAMLGIAPILDNEMFRVLKETADREKIPYQVEVMGGPTGTDADAVAVSGTGVRTALLSIPLKYMHMPIEVVACQDVEAVADLMAAYAKQMFGGAR